MSRGNAYKYRPEYQARMIENMNNPEWCRRREIYRKTRGKFLGYFDKKRLVADWNADWNLQGRPKDHPDFHEWLEKNRAKLTARRDEERAAQERINQAHADWVAKGMPCSTT